jgi:quinol-cytochrome oxidoreductase complex cytochrome b subunit
LFAPLKELLRTERERTVPAHFGRWNYIGALALVFLLVQTTTGILLMVYYRPSAASAYLSTGLIADAVRLGWLLRSVHHWGSDLLILLGFLHLMRVYFTRAYQAPRQINWVLGLVLLVLILTMGFTGILLPWDQYAYWYIDSARATISAIPGLGNVVLGLIWGGWELGEEVLLRFYSFHVGVLPWLAFSVLCVHLLFVWHFGIKEPVGVAGGAGPVTMRFLPDFVTNLFMVVLVVFGLLLSAAVLFPPVLLERADPLVPLVGAAPRWYLLPLREALRGLPGAVAALAVVAFTLVLFLVPVLDRQLAPSTRNRIVQRALGILVIAAWVVLAVLGARGYLR